jgi:uncharacterized protein with ParB-like and HNH nuclease domain
MSIITNDESIDDLLASTAQYKIPEFQRNYSWGTKQLDAFWDDLVLAKNKNHFFGPMVFVQMLQDKTDSFVSNNKKFLVVDGQQRLTTILVFLSAARDFLINKLGDPEAKDRSEKQSALYDLSIKNPKTNSYILEGNYQIREVLEEWILRKPIKASGNDPETFNLDTNRKAIPRNLKRKSAKLVEAWIYFYDKFKQFEGNEENKLEKIQDLVQACLNNFYILPLTVQNEEQAYILFESLNDRGLRLTPGDLLKSYVLSQIKSSSSGLDIAKSLEIWDEAEKKIQPVEMTTFLRHLLLLDFKKVSKDDIFSLFKKKVNDEGAEETLISINKYATIYGQIVGKSDTHENEKIAAALGRLNLIGVDTARVYLLALMNFVPEIKILEKGIRLLEYFTFRWVICNQNAQVYETLIQSATSIIVQSKGKKVEEAEEVLLSKLPSDEIFEESFKRNSKHSTSMATYILRKFEMYFSGNEIKLNSPKNLNVEHIAPDTMNDHWANVLLVGLDIQKDERKEWYDDIVDEIGNKTLLGAPINNKVKQRSWDDKRNGFHDGKIKYEGYGKSIIKTTLDIIGIENWDRDIIESRTKWMSQSAKDLWNPNSKNVNIISFSEFLKNQ